MAVLLNTHEKNNYGVLDSLKVLKQKNMVLKRFLNAARV